MEEDISGKDLETTEEWLRHEDEACFDDRLLRLEWQASKVPTSQDWLFHGGLVTKNLFEEARYCFVYGQFLASVLLGLAYIEITLAALSYAAGSNTAARADFSELLKRALNNGALTIQEYEELELIRKKRNAYAHFRKPLDKESIEYRALHQDDMPYDVIEEDARAVMNVALHFVEKSL